MPAAEEGCCTTVVREEPTRKPRSNSTSSRADHAKRRLSGGVRSPTRRADRGTRSRETRCRVQNQDHPTQTPRSDMSSASRDTVLPSGLRWSAATSAIQIEGSPSDDGEDARSGTISSMCRVRCETPRRRNARATAIGIRRRMSPWWRTSASTAIASRFRGRGCSRTGAARPAPPRSITTPASSMPCSRSARPRSRRCTTGRCRARWSPTAAGSSAIRPNASRTMPRSWRIGSAIG